MLARIRLAQESDLGAVTEIYNEAIRTTTATFDTDEKTLADRTAWFRTHGERHPILVAELDERIVGWASLSPWSNRSAYDETAETSFYVRASCRGRGIGRQLKQAIVAEAKRLNYHTLLARVADGSDASLHLNRSCGFKSIGVMKEVGRKFGRYIDVHLFQRVFDAG